jgi:predicted nucleic acid-binding protein
MKVFLDSNVIFSICWSGKERSRSYLLYELQKDGFFRIFISRLVHNEARFNLETRKPEGVRLFEELMRETEVLPDVSAATKSRELLSLPENDRIILSTAMYHEMDFFLTGNARDFKNLYHRKITKTTVLTPADFLNRKF